MKTKIIYLFAFLLLAVIGCDEKEDDFQNIKNSTLQVSVSVPEQAPNTRSIESPNNSKNIIVKWKQGNTIDLFFEQGNTLKLVKEIPLTNITNNGKKAQFEIEVPEGIDASKAYTLYGAHGCLTQIKDGKPITDVLMKTAGLNNGKSDFEVPMYFKQTINGNVPNIVFKHIGAMLVYNTYNKGEALNIHTKVPVVKPMGNKSDYPFYIGNDNAFDLRTEQVIATPNITNLNFWELVTTKIFIPEPHIAQKTIQWVVPKNISGTKPAIVHLGGEGMFVANIFARNMQVGKAYHLKLTVIDDELTVEGTEATTPNSMTLKTNKDKVKLFLFAHPSNQGNCWIDLNANSKRDQNENIYFGQDHEYQITNNYGTATIYGKVKHFKIPDSQKVTKLEVKHNPELIQLEVGKNPITQLDVSQNINLEVLMFMNLFNDDMSKKLATLDISKNRKLKKLEVLFTKIKNLDLSKNEKLEYLEASYNKLEELDVSANKNIGYVNVYENKLTKLNVANGNNKNWKGLGADDLKFNAQENPQLSCIKVDKDFVPDETKWQKDDTADWNNTAESCEDYTPSTMTLTSTKNSIKLIINTYASDRPNVWIDLNGNGKKDSGEKVTEFSFSEKNYNKTANTITIYGRIISFGCNKNSLTSLDVSKNSQLKELWCSLNSLRQLDVSKNKKLELLSCTHNYLLTKLDVSKNTNLKILSCFRNSLKELDVSKNSQLNDLGCSHNSLTKLNVANGNNSNITEFSAENNSLTCIKVDKNFTPPTSWKKDDDASWHNDGTDCP